MHGEGVGRGWKAEELWDEKEEMWKDYMKGKGAWPKAWGAARGWMEGELGKRKKEKDAERW